jgi:tetratricopeptide (TPR) repeat protein
VIETHETLDRARKMLRVNKRAALELIRTALSADPESAEAHALLSWVLVDSKRIFAAEFEAREAIRLEPERPNGYHALGAALLAQRKPKPAREALDRAIALDPDEPLYLATLARVLKLQGKRDEALATLKRAVELDPGEPSLLAAYGELLLELGRLDEAEKVAEQASSAQPDNDEVLLLRGRLALYRGKVDEARDFAIWALREDPTDDSALHLLAEVKARQSLFLGLWWRYVVFMVAQSDTGQMLTLIGAYLFVQLSAQLVTDFVSKQGGELIRWGWLLLVGYSFTAPSYFRRLVERELKEVRLKPGF